VSNLLYVDQPTGTGFSYSTDNRDIRHDEDGVSNDLYDFLQVLMFSPNVIVYYTTSVQCFFGPFWINNLIKHFWHQRLCI
jgi:hypothetical protein